MGKYSISVRKQVVLMTSLAVNFISAKIASIFLIACSVWSLTSSEIIFPVEGSMPNCPERKMNPLAFFGL